MPESICKQCGNMISVELVTDEYCYEDKPTYYVNGEKKHNSVLSVEPVIKDNKVIILTCLYTNRDVQRDMTVVKQCNQFKKGAM